MWDFSCGSCVASPTVQWAIIRRDKSTFRVTVSEKLMSKQSFCFAYVFPSITIGTTWNADYSIFRIMLIIFSISFQNSLNLRPNRNTQKQLLLFSPINASICYSPVPVPKITFSLIGSLNLNPQWLTDGLWMQYREMAVHSDRTKRRKVYNKEELLTYQCKTTGSNGLQGLFNTKPFPKEDTEPQPP